MLQKKVCLLGSFAVGKTSLVQQFVQGIFSDRYLTTVGVKIDRKALTVDERTLSLVLWDLAGEDEYLHVQDSYLRGIAGYLLVVDGTRRATVDQTLKLRQRHASHLDGVPGLLLVNKSDLKHRWQLDDAATTALASLGLETLETSAKTGENVERAFATLARRLVTVNG